MTVSYSGLMLYEQCPSAFNRRYNLKQETKESPPSDAMERGLRVHQEVEAYLEGSFNRVPKEALCFKDLLTAMRDTRNPLSEVKWGLTVDWELTHFDDKNDGMVRGIFDAVYQIDETVMVLEWKTGKIYPDHGKQRSLYGLAGLAMYPDAEWVNVQTVYFDQDDVKELAFSRAQAKPHERLWHNKIQSAVEPQEYPQKPSWKCKYCNYNAANGGECNGEAT